MLLNDSIVDIEKHDVICLPTLAVHDFSVFLNPSIFSIKDLRSAEIKNGVSSDFCY